MVLVPLMSWITCADQMSSLENEVLQIILSIPLTRCLYSCDWPVIRCATKLLRCSMTWLSEFQGKLHKTMYTTPGCGTFNLGDTGVITCKSGGMYIGNMKGGSGILLS